MVHGCLSLPIDPDLSGDELVAFLVDSAQMLPETPRVQGVGLGLAASVLKSQLPLVEMTALHGIGGYPLCERVSQRLGKPCLIDNDANLALLGEAHFGSARGHSDVLLLTLGTGVGGGVMLGGHLRRGVHSSGCELGLTAVPSPVGTGYTSLESLASPGALMVRLGEPRGRLFERADAGDQEAKRLVEQMFEYLGMVIANVHILLDLELVLLGGGLASSGHVLREGVQAAFRRICPRSLQFGLSIELAGLAPDMGGVIGAACLFLEEHGCLQRM
jgi:glucokinase